MPGVPLAFHVAEGGPGDLLGLGGFVGQAVQGLLPFLPRLGVAFPDLKAVFAEDDRPRLMVRRIRDLMGEPGVQRRPLFAENALGIALARLAAEDHHGLAGGVDAGIVVVLLGFGGDSVPGEDHRQLERAGSTWSHGGEIGAELEVDLLGLARFLGGTHEVEAVRLAELGRIGDAELLIGRASHERCLQPRPPKLGRDVLSGQVQALGAQPPTLELIRGQVPGGLGQAFFDGRGLVRKRRTRPRRHGYRRKRDPEGETGAS